MRGSRVKLLAEDFFVNELPDDAPCENGDDLNGREWSLQINGVADDTARKQREKFGGVDWEIIERGDGDSHEENDNGDLSDDHKSHPREKISNAASNGGGEIVFVVAEHIGVVGVVDESSFDEHSGTIGVLANENVVRATVGAENFSFQATVNGWQ